MMLSQCSPRSSRSFAISLFRKSSPSQAIPATSPLIVFAKSRRPFSSSLLRSIETRSRNRAKERERRERPEDEEVPPQRSATVAIVGVPNVGKSALVNALVTRKVSAVSPKINTTRVNMLGVLTEGTTQLQFFDTPGLMPLDSDIKDKSSGSSDVKTRAWGSLDTADVAAFTVDASRYFGNREHRVLKGIHQAKTPKKVLLLNKADLVRPRSRLLDLSSRIAGLSNFDATFMTCATSGEGIGDFKDYLLSIAPERAWAYPDTAHTDASEEEQVTEIIREQVYQMFQKEVPYRVSQETIRFEDDGTRIYVDQALVVRQPSHKAILEGKGKRMLALIATNSRAEITSALRRTHVELRLTVKHRH